MDKKTRDLMEHDNRTCLAETCGARDVRPSSNLGRVKQGEAIRADVIKPTIGGRHGLTSTICKRHAERVRTCFAQVLGKARTDPLERRDRRRTQANDAERE